MSERIVNNRRCTYRPNGQPCLQPPDSPIHAAEPTSSVNHLNTCQTPTMAYCQERAEFWLTIPETGMHTAPADIMACEFHASELRMDYSAEIFDVVR